MNLKNLMMWGVNSLFNYWTISNIFQNPNRSVVKINYFSEFLQNIEDGRVVEVEIQGNNIEGILSNGTAFNTYSPNDPNLVEKLTP